jgi:hypothetical protein
MVKNRKKNIDDTIIVEEEELEGLANGKLMDLAQSITEDDQATS